MDKISTRQLRAFFGALAILCALGIQARAAGEVMTYQGRLKELGLPVTGNKNVTVFFCTTPSGAPACTSSGLQIVAVSSGLFRTNFTVPASVDLSVGTWYLEVQVGIQVLAPREQLTYSPYAIYATSAAVAASVAVGSIDSTKIAAGAVDSSKLATGAVDTNKLASDSVTTIKIAAGAVDSSKIAAGAIDSNKLANSSVDTNKLVNGSVTSAKIAAGAIDSSKLAVGSVDSGKLAANSVNTTNLVTDSVTGVKILNGTIDSTKLNLAGLGIGSGVFVVGSARTLTFGQNASVGSLGMDDSTLSNNGSLLNIFSGSGGSAGAPASGGNLSLTAGGGFNGGSGGAVVLTPGIGAASGYVHINGSTGGAHLRATQTTPPTLNIVNCGTLGGQSITGTDMAGLLTFNNTTAGLVGCTITVTFNRPYAAAPKAVLIFPAAFKSADVGGTGVGSYVDAAATAAGSFQIKVNNFPPSPFTYAWYFMVIE